LEYLSSLNRDITQGRKSATVEALRASKAGEAVASMRRFLHDNLHFLCPRWWVTKSGASGGEF